MKPDLTHEQVGDMFEDPDFQRDVWREMLDPGPELDSVLAAINEGADTLEHEGPGTHPGTGTEQTVHSGGGGGAKSKPKDPPKGSRKAAANKLHKEMTSNPEGFSFNPFSEKRPETGFMVGIKKGPVFRADQPREQLVEDIYTWVKAGYTSLTDKEDVYAGGWLNHEDNTYHLDISKNVFDESMATRLGNENDEKAIWDIDNSVEIRLK